MTNIEYAIIDELYFVISFKELLAQLDFDKELLENELRKLYQKGWIRIYDGIDKELENHVLLDESFSKYRFFVSEKGLSEHNSIR